MMILNKKERKCDFFYNFIRFCENYVLFLHSENYVIVIFTS